MSDLKHSKLVRGCTPSQDGYVELFIDGRQGVLAEVDETLADEMIRRWGSHDALIEALNFLDNECDSGDPKRIGRAQIIVRRVVTRSQGDES